MVRLISTYKGKVEEELNNICDDILKLLDEDLIKADLEYAPRWRVAPNARFARGPALAAVSWLVPGRVPRRARHSHSVSAASARPHGCLRCAPAGPSPRSSTRR